MESPSQLPPALDSFSHPERTPSHSAAPSETSTAHVPPVSRTDDEPSTHHPQYHPAKDENPSASKPSYTRALSSFRSRARSQNDNDSVDSDEQSLRRRESLKQEGWTLEGAMLELKRRLEGEGNAKSLMRQLDVSWKELCVRGVGADAVYGQTIGSMFNPMTSRNDKKRAAQAEKILVKEKSDRPSEKSESKLPDYSDKLGKNEKFLIQGFNGVLKGGEMALVLGRPGSGCTTFLKAITNIRQGYAGVDGDVRYGTMNEKDARQYSGQIIFSSEDDIHYPDLTVTETLDFALKMKTPSGPARPAGESKEEFQGAFKDTLLKMMDIEHTAGTKVGDENVRGVSGGERKRVSLAEALANRAPIVCYDQPTRGLDASTALSFTQSIRTITDISKGTNMMTLYQAGNQIYDLFDKVMVIAGGHCIYWGPMNQAVPYFEDLGLVLQPGSNKSDFLTACTVATERVVAKGKEGTVPNSIEEFAAAYLASDIHKAMQKEMEEYDSQDALKLREDQTLSFRESVRSEQAKSVGKNSLYTTSLGTQVAAAIVRQYQLLWNDKASLAIKQGGSTLLSIILGSLFYMIPKNTNGLFTTGGVLFLILLFNALLGIGETTASFKGRFILSKHKSYGMYSPAALILAQVCADLPIVALQVTAFLLPIYFMANLRQSAGAFFTLWFITYVTTHALLNFFRAIGFAFASIEGASAVSGFLLGVQILYTGYLIPQTSFKPWLGWTRWLNPLYYALESAFENELSGVSLPCAGTSLVPSGPGYTQTGTNFACTVAGSGTGATSVDGQAYMSAMLGYEKSHLWRNVGIVIAWWFFYVFCAALAVERLKAAGSSKDVLLFQRPKDNKKAANALAAAAPRDEEEAIDAQPVNKQKSGSGQATEIKLEKTSTVFTWNNLNYTVPVPGGKRQLLCDVKGYTQPGKLTALMGSSGAGKTTLLDVLAKRKEEGEVTGDLLVDGRPAGKSFQRTTGYVNQMDIHESTQTVRESLIFSALLRQPQSVSYEDKIAYVDSVIEVLELNDLKDAIVGTVGAGLGVEQRKRLTIGVELVSKPILLFLDEPSSGLDGQSSFNILRFLRKLADSGQSMLVTIHQPSALLFNQFDNLLLLAKGGKTVYHGPLGENGQIMKDYFARQGLVCPEEANPAEYMIDIVSGPLGKGRDWPQIWLDSEEYQTLCREIEEINKDALSKEPSYQEDGRYYASSLGTQIKLATQRASSSIYRQPDYIMARIGLCVGSAFLNSLSFLNLNNSVGSLQNRLFSVFQAMFVAPGLFNQIQPRLIKSRSLWEAREKPSKMLGWFPFVLAEIVAEAPWMILSSMLFFACWYFLVFQNHQLQDPAHAGGMAVELILYYLWVLGFAQFVAVLSPTAEAAALFNSIPIGLFSSFSGVLVPYPQITAFWRYWFYYLNPWSYILGAKIFFVNHDVPVVCATNEFAVFTPPSGQTCGQYMAPYIATFSKGYLLDPSSTTNCQYCSYSIGDEYLSTVNLYGAEVGWRNVGITGLFVVAFFVFVGAGMRWRNRRG